MSAALPAEIEARLAAAAAALDLERPTIMELSGGVSNRTFRLRDRSHDYVLRLAGLSAAGLGASGTSEVAMQALAADAGLAPPLVLADVAAGLVVSRYVAGRMPTARELQDVRLLRRVGAFIAQLHALEPPPGLPVVDFGERAAGYLDRVAAAGVDVFALRLQRELARRRAALPAPSRRAPCHHDLHHRNFLDDGSRLLAVDWEYAGPGDPAADLASCIGYNAITGARAEALYDGYGADAAELRARVAATGWIFDCLWYGWNAVAALDGLNPDPEEQSRLAARLGS